MQALFEALSPKIAEICRVSGTPAVSLGVQHREGVYVHNYGLRDVQARLVPTSDTNYCIASMSKAFASAALGILVEEGKLGWDTRVKELLPSFEHCDKTIKNMLTVGDLLSHRTGLQQADSLWEALNFVRGEWKNLPARLHVYPRRERLMSTGAENERLLDQNQTLTVFENLQPVKSFRGSFQYNNWSYALVGEIIEHLTGAKYADFVAKRIFEPLGMTRTSIHGMHEDTTNVAEAYQTLDDGSPYRIPRPHEGGNTMMASASGAKSNVNDLLKFYRTILDESKRQFFDRGVHSKILKQLPTILSNHQVMTVPNYREKSYGYGWARAQLPTTIGDIGTNPSLVAEMPTLARGTSSLVWWHQGSLTGFASFVAILPEEDAVIVVLTNSTALNDSADWIGQILVETLLDSPEKNDYVLFARESAWRALELAQELEKELDEQRDRGTKPKALSEYTGTFTNASGIFSIRIWQGDAGLCASFQNRRSQTYQLIHHHHDTFCWYLHRIEQIKRARWFVTDPDLYLLHFKFRAGEVERLVWKFDPEVLEGAVFYKSGTETK